jgi:hypothetical protein
MDEGEDRVLSASRKQSKKREPRFQFGQEERPESRVFFPDFSQAEIEIIPAGNDTFAISITDSSRAGRILRISPEKAFSRLGIDEQTIHNIAQDFSIQDFTLLRIVLAIAADQSRASTDYAVAWQGSPEFGATHEEYGLLRDVDELSDKLGWVLRELASRANGHQRSAVSLLAKRLVDERLLEALDRVGQRLSEIEVTECIRPAERPRDGQRRRVVDVLASAWPLLTGTKPSPWEGSAFHKFVDRVCRFLKLRAGPSPTAMADWLKKKPLKHEDQNKSVKDSD